MPDPAHYIDSKVSIEITGYYQYRVILEHPSIGNKMYCKDFSELKDALEFVTNTLRSPLAFIGALVS